MTQANLILFACRDDGTVPVIKALSDTEGLAVDAAANDILAEHRSCDVVEVWADSALTAVVRRQ